MNLRSFLRLYIGSALLCACGFWAVACSSMLLDTRRVVPQPQVKQSSHNISPVKSGIASYERESPTETVQPETERLPVVASPGSGARAVALSRGVQTFRGGAAGRDRSSIYAIGSGPSRGMAANLTSDQVGIKAHRHLEAFVWHPHYLAAQHLCAVPVRTIAAVVKAESGGDPWALSPSGARGLMQVLPSTAAELGDFDLWNPAQNLVAGSCILRGHLDRRGGDLKAALADYHAGAWRTSTGPATRAYVEDVMGSAQ